MHVLTRQSVSLFVSLSLPRPREPLDFVSPRHGGRIADPSSGSSSVRAAALIGRVHPPPFSDLCRPRRSPRVPRLSLYLPPWLESVWPERGAEGGDADGERRRGRLGGRHPPAATDTRVTFKLGLRDTISAAESSERADSRSRTPR